MDIFVETANSGRHYNVHEWVVAQQWCRCTNACLITLVAFILILTLLWRRESRCDFYLLSIPILPMINKIVMIPVSGNFIWNK